MDIRTRRAYDDPGADDGYRVLVDRLWPRGVSKDDLKLDDWNKDVAPSDDLRKWFDHDPDKWDEFQRRYHKELDARTAPMRDLLDHVKAGRVTLVYGARDEEHNNAVALRAFLRDKAG